MSYVQDAVRTESLSDSVKERLVLHVRQVHSLMGMETEVGELFDAFKRHIYYGTPMDNVNIKEELGDILWYVAIMCDCYELSIEEVMAANIAKLRKRYPHKFNEHDAVNRDIAEEQEILRSEHHNKKTEGS